MPDASSALDFGEEVEKGTLSEGRARSRRLSMLKRRRKALGGVISLVAELG